MLLLGIGACRLTEDITETPKEDDLSLSTHVLRFDTVFSEVQGYAQQVYLYNKLARGIRLHRVFLPAEEGSDFYLYIDGKKSRSFENIVVMAQDSLRLFVEIYPKKKQMAAPQEVAEEVIISFGTIRKDIALEALVQDVATEERLHITTDTRWTKEEVPYLVTETLVVAKDIHLSLTEGTRVFFAKEASFIVHGTLSLLGHAEKPIILKNDRLNEDHQRVPGQWQGLVLSEKSGEHHLKHTKILNATTGITVEKSDHEAPIRLNMEHVFIQNMSHGGIVSHDAIIIAENVLINNCKNALLAHTAGEHSYKHCTFANVPNDFLRLAPSFFWEDGAGESHFSLSIEHSILWGDRAESFLLSLSTENESRLHLHNNILRTTWPLLRAYEENLFPPDHTPGFVAIDADTPPDYRPAADSPAVDAASNSTVSHDIVGNVRDDSPDIGAFERTLNTP